MARNNGSSQEPSQANPKKLLSFTPDDDGNAQAVMYLYSGRIAYTDALGWLWYTGSHWSADDALANIELAIVETFRARGRLSFEASDEGNAGRMAALRKASALTTRNRNACREMLRPYVTVPISDFDANPDLLNCKNGTLHLKTGKLEPHNPDDLLRHLINANYRPQAENKELTGFLRGLVGNDSQAYDFLLECLGYSLTGHNSEERMFYLKGPTRSGKGTLTSIMLELLGRPLASGADFQTFTNPRDGDTQNFDLAGLAPTRFVAASESRSYQRLNEAKIKQITGRDPIRCAHKHRPHFEYSPRFKIWLASNHPINMNEDDDAAWARVVSFVFPTSYLGREDKKLKERLTQPDALEAMLTLCAEGARRWYASPRGLVLPDSIAANAQADRESLDYISQFVNEYYEVVSSASIENRRAWLPSREVYQQYKEWAESGGYPVKKWQSFAQALERRGVTAGRKYVAGKQQRCYLGIVEKEDEPESVPGFDDKPQRKTVAELADEQQREKSRQRLGVS